MLKKNIENIKNWMKNTYTDMKYQEMHVFLLMLQYIEFICPSSPEDINCQCNLRPMPEATHGLMAVAVRWRVR